jgi:hypothetical protein
VISENGCDRTRFINSMINVMDSIEAQYTILGFKQNEKKQLIKTTQGDGFLEAALTDEK